MDMSELMKLAGQLTQQMKSAQDDAANMRACGESGGGLIRAVMNGKHELVELHIDPKTMDPNEVHLVEDLVRAAVNQASHRVAEGLQQRIGSMAQGLGIDPSLLGGVGGGGQQGDQ